MSDDAVDGVGETDKSDQTVEIEETPDEKAEEIAEESAEESDDEATEPAEIEPEPEPEPAILRATGIRARQGSRDLLPTTSLTLEAGEVAVAVGPPGGGHTSLALALAGRLKLDAGRVTLDGDPAPRALQAAVALVDVPGVSEPDEVVSFRTILGEELAMAKHKPSAAAIDRWLTDYDLASGITTEAVPPRARLEILARMAANLESSPADAARWASIERTVEPDRAWKGPMDERYRRFLELAGEA